MPKQAGPTGARREISYIVRVYRCDAEGIAGIVEMPVAQRRTPFKSFARLEAILTGTFPGGDRPQGRNKERKTKSPGGCV